MKATLEFNLPEDREEHLMAVKSLELHLSLWDIDQYLRERMKYGNLKQDKYEVYEEVRNQLYEIMDHYNVRFNS